MVGKNRKAGMSIKNPPAAAARAEVRGMVLGNARFPAIRPTLVPPGLSMWVAQIMGGPSTCRGVFGSAIGYSCAHIRLVSVHPVMGVGWGCLCVFLVFGIFF